MPLSNCTAAEVDSLRSEVAYRRRLLDIGNKIHAATDLDEILIHLKDEVADLFGAQRITIYAVDSKRKQLVSRYKSGDEIAEIRLAIAPDSIAGYAAYRQQLLNIRSVDDPAELGRIDPLMRFDGRWDRESGFKTRQILACPIIHKQFLLGVVQLINRIDEAVFSPRDERSIRELAHILGIAFYKQNLSGSHGSNPFSTLIEDHLLTVKELEQAVADARRRQPILITVDETFNVISVNRSLERFGRQHEPISARRFVIPLKSEINAHLESGQIQVRELVIAGIRDVAARYTFNAVVSSIPSDSGRRAVLLSITDVSEQKKAEQEIIRSLKEKEVLLREIHHRVKNNMQVISSLLRLQSRHTGDQKSLALLQESQNRIIAMALVHEKLYRSTDFVNLDLKDYINTLISGLRRSYGALCKRIVFKVQVGAVHLGVDSLIPCGLIVNELVTNSIKYAFPNNGRGTIVIRIDALPDNGVQLEVRDDGVGLPANFDARRTRSLGLLLVTMLSESQLHGEVRIESAGGTAFIIAFSEDGSTDIAARQPPPTAGW